MLRRSTSRVVGLVGGRQCHTPAPVKARGRMERIPSSGLHRTELVPPVRVRNNGMAPGFELESQVNGYLPYVQKLNAEQRIAWASATFPGHVAMSTSFGITSAVLLHLATTQFPHLPVVWIDTGYLPPETYQYAQDLHDLLDLNLFVSTSAVTPARMEAVYGQLWEHGDTESHQLYGKMRKNEPLRRSLQELDVKCLIVGLQRGQTKHRAKLPALGLQYNAMKLLPLLEWSKSEMEAYMDDHQLPRHPLQPKGYVSVGDWHSSRALQADDCDGDDCDERAGRFGGVSQECGLHTDGVAVEPEPTQPEPTQLELAQSEPEALETANAQASRQADAGASAQRLVKQQLFKQALLHRNGTARRAGQLLGSISGQQGEVYNLEGDRNHPTVIMVKKRMADGSDCRRCKQIQERIEQDDFQPAITETVYAVEGDQQSEGMRLSKDHKMRTAPFFLVTMPGDGAAESRTVAVESYFKLRKMLKPFIDDEKPLQSAPQQQLWASAGSGKVASARPEAI